MLHIRIVHWTGREADRPALGSSEEKGRPEPPPVLSPMMVTLGSIFILFTKSLVALKERRLVSTTACFCQRTRSSDGSSQTALGVEKSLCPGPVYGTYSLPILFSFVKRAANFSAVVRLPPELFRTSIINPSQIASLFRISSRFPSPIPDWKLPQ